MRIVKIYANKHFRNIEFNALFNVVLATIFDKVSNKDVHNLGKTSLIHVINFLLLGSFDRKIFGNKKVFTGVVFYGEIELNNGKFLTIRREIDNPTKISFKLSELKSVGFNPPQEWDAENVAFDKSRETLNTYLGFNVLTDFEYRKSITYFLRTQQDFLDVYQLNKFNKGKHITWKPFVFELLGYDAGLISEKLELEETIEAKRKTIEILKTETNVDIDERDRLVGLQEIKKQEAQEAQSTIDKFNFFEKDKAINKELINDIDIKIQELNTERYRVSYEISKIEESLQSIIGDVNAENLIKLFEEANLYYSAELKKDYEELLRFNEAISKERKMYLSENLQTLREEYKDVNASIKQLEQEKSDKLSYLTERDSYDKFKKYQIELSKTEAEIERLSDKIAAIDQSIRINTEIAEEQQKVDAKVAAIRMAINSRKHAEINRIFNSIIYDILGTNAVISIKLNKQGNVEFDANYLNPNDLASTSEAQGTTYKKLLCMAFDLSLLIYYAKNSFFRFVYHDGILEGLDDRIKIRLLDKVKELCTEYNIQYILSLIDSDIPNYPAGNNYLIRDEEICLELIDKDESGALFLHAY
jgi:uncharacterized protein YydD (DUF2326 family)